MTKPKPKNIEYTREDLIAHCQGKRICDETTKFYLYIAERCAMKKNWRGIKNKEIADHFEKHRTTVLYHLKVLIAFEMVSMSEDHFYTVILPS